MTKSLVCAIAALGLASSAHAVVLTFDELSPQPVDGLTVEGVTFHFTIGGSSSLDATYGALGPGNTVYVQDPVLEGSTAGVLTLDFAQPTPVLSFGVALSTFATLTPGFNVQLFDASLNSLGTTGVDTSSLISFSEGQFNYSGTPVSRAIIDFSGSPPRFALDNLTFGPINAVPDSGNTWALLCGGVIALLGMRAAPPRLRLVGPTN